MSLINAVRSDTTTTNVPERTINRYYDPTTDQFLSIDPALMVTDQPYMFTNDDPLNATDPLGLALNKIERLLRTNGERNDSERFPLTAKSNQVLYRVKDGKITNYEVYDSEGKPTMRVDLEGPAHNGVETPHAVDLAYEENVNPETHVVYPKVVETSEVYPVSEDFIPSESFESSLIGSSESFWGTIWSSWWDNGGPESDSE